MAARWPRRLRTRLGVLVLGLACAPLISASAIAQGDAPRRPATAPVAEATAPEPAARPPAEPAPPPFVRVLTEREKRCRLARSCAMDRPCPPCDR